MKKIIVGDARMISKILKVNVLKTIWMNFRLFKFSIAIKFPLLIGWKVFIIGCRRNMICLSGNVHTGMVLIGITGSRENVIINGGRTCIHVEGQLVLKGVTKIARGCALIVGKKSKMTLGKNFSCNTGTIVSATGAGITIGDGFMAGGNVTIRDSDGHKVVSINDGSVLEKKNTKPIVIGNHVWVANNSIILKGVSIGCNSVIATGTICTKSIVDDNVLIAGIPGKIIEKSINWDY